MIITVHRLYIEGQSVKVKWIRDTKSTEYSYLLYFQVAKRKIITKTHVYKGITIACSREGIQEEEDANRFFEGKYEHHKYLCVQFFIFQCTRKTRMRLEKYLPGYICL